MAVYEYALANRKRDLSEVLSTVIANEPRFISSFPRRGIFAVARKHEWLEDQIAGRSLTVVSISESTVTASADDVAKVLAGTLFTVKNDTALFRVTAKPTSTTFTIELVAANGSDTTAPSAEDALNIVSTPMKEATSDGDGEDSHRVIGKDYNYTMILRKDIVVSGTALAVDTFDNVENSINRQTEFALAEAVRDLNRLALYGHRVEPGIAVNGAFGGLYEFGVQTGGLYVDASSATLDSFIVNDAAQAVLGEGGNPTQILCSPGQARVLSNEYKGNLHIVREDTMRGAYVALVVNEINGRTMSIMADPDMPDNECWVNDIDGFALAPLKGRDLADVDATPKGFDGIKRTAIGELTLEFRNAKQRLCRVYNLKPSAQALTELRTGTSS
jgi:hypothetical protein